MKLNEKVSLYSITVNMVLLILKGSAAFLSGSISALAETIHSVIDLFASVIVFIGLKISKIKSKKFPYGLYKVENIVSILVAGFILFAGYEIVQEAIIKEYSPVKNFYTVLGIYIIVLIITYAFSKYELKVAKKIGSPSLLVDGNHIKIDMFSVGAVMIGIIGESIGFRVDKITSMLIVIFILKAGIEIIINAMKVLLDGSLDEASLNKIRNIILAEPSVKKVKELKGRNSGNYIFIVADIVIDLINFNEAHKITEKLENAIKEEFINAEMIKIHYEPALKYLAKYETSLIEQRKEFSKNSSKRVFKEKSEEINVKNRFSGGNRRGMNEKAVPCPRRKEIFRAGKLSARYLKHSFVAVIMVMVLFTGLSAAQIDSKKSLVIDHPDFTESVEVVPPGVIQFESSYTFKRHLNIKNYTVGELLIHAGIMKRMELQIGLNSFLTTRSPTGNISGIEDGSIGLKFKLFDGVGDVGIGMPGAGLIIATSIPDGGSCCSENCMQPTVLLAFAKDVSERLSLGSNLAYTYASDNECRHNQFHAAFTGTASLAERYGCYLEYYQLFPANEDIHNAGYINGGLTYLVNNNFQLDTRLGIGITNDCPDFYVGLGFAFRYFR
ncbi:cation diffusion facilitator family transporter [candidate division KSB1 bacterium]